MVDQREINDFKREYLEPMAMIRWNTVQFRNGWTKKTMRATLEVCYWAWKKGLYFATEVKMLNGRRADVIIPGTRYPVIEIMDSEKIGSIMVKKEDYEGDGVAVLSISAGLSKKRIGEALEAIL